MTASQKIRRVLLVHPSGLMYSEVYLLLEPLGLELVAAACRRNGYLVRLLDLQASTHKEYFQTIQDWRPDAIGYSLNYLANIPEVLDLVKATRQRLPEALLSLCGSSLHHPYKAHQTKTFCVEASRRRGVQKEFLGPAGIVSP